MRATITYAMAHVDFEWYHASSHPRVRNNGPGIVTALVVSLSARPSCPILPDNRDILLVLVAAVLRRRITPRMLPLRTRAFATTSLHLYVPVHVCAPDAAAAGLLLTCARMPASWTRVSLAIPSFLDRFLIQRTLTPLGTRSPSPSPPEVTGPTHRSSSAASTSSTPAPKCIFITPSFPYHACFPRFHYPQFT